MSFKIFPIAAKIPLIKGWQQQASDDPEVHKLWVNMFRGKMTHYGIPTGPTNDLLVLDVDLKGNGYETLKKYQIPDTAWQSTPSGGRHYLFRYPKDGHRYGNRVQFAPGLDTRGEGGYIVWYGGDTGFLAEPPPFVCEAARKVQNQQAPEIPGYQVATSIALKLIQASLDNIREAPTGESNDVLNIESFRIGQLVASGSITRDYAFQELFNATKERGKPEYESRATINSGLNGGASKPLQQPFGATPPVTTVVIPDPRGTIWTPTKTTREELMDVKHLRKPQLFEHWSTEDIAITTADGGTGKTTLKLFEAVCLALGDRFLGFRCIQPGRTLFITGEDTDRKIKAMLGQILRQMDLTEDPRHNEEVETVLNSIYVKKDSDLCLIVKDKQNFLLPNLTALEQISQAVNEIRPKLIVFDPISSFWGSEASLNDMAKAVTKFMSKLVEISGACVEMINHMGKQSSSAKDMSQFAGRGGTGLPSHSRVSRTLREIGQQEYTKLTTETMAEKQSAMLCNVNKFSDGSPLYNKPFLIVREGFLFSRKLMTEAKAREAEQQLTDVERVFQFVKECRQKNQFPSRPVIAAFFKACGNPIPKTRTESALELLEFTGHLGDRIKRVENPDASVGGKVYVITDMDGKE